MEIRSRPVSDCFSNRLRKTRIRFQWMDRVRAHLRNREFFSHLGACMTNTVAKEEAYVVPFEQLRMTDVEIVGGKNASLGEMISQLAGAGVRVPTGFATTALAFRDFLNHNNLTERIAKRLETLDIDDVKSLAEAGKEIRQWIIDAPMQ